MAQWHSIDLTDLDLMPSTDRVREAPGAAVRRAADVAREATYITVGLGLLTFQRLQVRRRELERSLRR